MAYILHDLGVLGMWERKRKGQANRVRHAQRVKALFCHGPMLLMAWVDGLSDSTVQGS